jgi:hypothetical protein
MLEFSVILSRDTTEKEVKAKSPLWLKRPITLDRGGKWHFFISKLL